HHRIIVGVRHHREPFARQRFRGFEKPLRIGEERARIADDLELHHLAQAGLARVIACPDHLVRRIAARRVGQGRVARRVGMVEQRLTRGQADPAQRHRDDLRAGSLVGLLHVHHRRVLARPLDETRREFLAPDDQTRVVHGSSLLPYPPPIGLTSSTRSPSRSTVASYALFGVTSRFTATAVYWRLTPSCFKRPSTLRPSALRRPLPLTTIFISKTAAPLHGCGRWISGSPCSLRWNYPGQVRGVPGRTRFSGFLPPRRLAEVYIRPG